MLEGVVIVASILLAFGIDAWWNGHQDRQAEEVYIGRIAADLTETRDQIIRASERYEMVLEHGGAILPVLTGEHELPGDIVGFLASVLQASRITEPVVARSAYDDLISTGNLRVIRDATLRTALSQFYATVENALRPVDFVGDQTPYRAVVRGLLPSDLQMIIRESCLEDAPLECKDSPPNPSLRSVAEAVVAEPDLDRKLNLSMQAMSIRLVASGGIFSGGFGLVFEDIDALLTLIDPSEGR